MSCHALPAYFRTVCTAAEGIRRHQAVGIRGVLIGRPLLSGYSYQKNANLRRRMAKQHVPGGHYVVLTSKQASRSRAMKERFQSSVRFLHQPRQATNCMEEIQVYCEHGAFANMLQTGSIMGSGYRGLGIEIHVVRVHKAATRRSTEFKGKIPTT